MCHCVRTINSRTLTILTRASTRCQRYRQRLRPAVAERVRGAAQVFGMVMTVNPIKHLDRHAEKAGRLPFVDAILHQPGRGGVTQGVRTDPSAQKELPGPRDRAISAYFALADLQLQYRSVGARWRRRDDDDRCANGACAEAWKRDKVHRWPMTS